MLQLVIGILIFSTVYTHYSEKRDRKEIKGKEIEH